MNRNLKHFKLTNNDEVLGEIISGPDSDANVFVARNVMQIVSYNHDYQTTYVFKPWLHYVESSDAVIAINPNQICGSTNPNHALVFQYDCAVAEMHFDAAVREKNFSDLQIEGMEKILNSITSAQVGIDSASNNIIKFPTTH